MYRYNHPIIIRWRGLLMWILKYLFLKLEKEKEGEFLPFVGREANIFSRIWVLGYFLVLSSFDRNIIKHLSNMSNW